MQMQISAMRFTESAPAERRAAGFTLIELMITVAIVAIVSAVAYPAYTTQIMRGQRSAGQTFLLDLAQRQEQFFLDQRAYSAALGQLGYAAVPPEVINQYAAPTLTPVAGPPAGYTISLAPLAGTRLASHNDGTLWINSLSQRWREVDGDGAYTPGNDCTFEEGTCKPQ
jgi:type IV pilus assembly protein PilE